MSPAEGARQLEIEVKGIILEINANARDRASRGVNLLRNAALEVLGQNGSGRVYKRGGRVQVASVAGSPPAPDFGNLRKNWRQAVMAYPNGKGLGVRIHMKITSDMFYQPFLEHGTRKMAARPHMERIKTKARPQITALFASI